MSSLILPKIELNVSITILLNSPFTVHGHIFAESCSPFRNGPETLDDFLNHRKDLFFPFFDIEQKRFFQLNRSKILYLSETWHDAEQILGPPAVVYLSSGNSHTVAMITDLPSDHSRLQDYLNLDRNFLMFLKGDKMMYFNREYIVKVTENE